MKKEEKKQIIVKKSALAVNQVIRQRQIKNQQKENKK